MGLPTKLLADGERVLLVLRPHVRRLARPALVLVVLAPVAAFAAASVPAGAARAPLRLVLAAIAVVVALRFVVWPFVLWWNTLCVLTDERIFERQGVVRRYGHDLMLRGVTDVAVAQRLGERLLRTGTLKVTTEGGAEFEVKDVPAVAVLQRSLLAVADDVAVRPTPSQGAPRAELGEPGTYGAPDPFGEHDGADDGPDERGELDAPTARPGRREARRRDREHVRRLRELQSQARRVPAPTDESAFESLVDPADGADPHHPAASLPPRDREAHDDHDDHGGDAGRPPGGARILRFPRRP